MRGVVWHVYDRISKRDRFFNTRRQAFSYVDIAYADPRGVFVARCGPDEDYIVRDFDNPPRRKAVSA